MRKEAVRIYLSTVGGDGSRNRRERRVVDGLWEVSKEVFSEQITDLERGNLIFVRAIVTVSMVLDSKVEGAIVRQHELISCLTACSGSQ